MFKTISKKLVNSAVRRKIINVAEIDNCLYGLNAFLTLAVNVLSALIIGLIMHMPLETVLFILVFKLLRKYVGGSHSKTALRCYISSCATYLLVLMLIKHYPLLKTVSFIITLTSAVILYIISPVEAEKKPLDYIERVVFRKRSRITVIVCVCAFMLLYSIDYIPYAYYCSTIISVSMCTVTLFAITGKLKLDHNKKRLGLS